MLIQLTLPLHSPIPLILAYLSWLLICYKAYCYYGTVLVTMFQYLSQIMDMLLTLKRRIIIVIIVIIILLSLLFYCYYYCHYYFYYCYCYYYINSSIIIIIIIIISIIIFNVVIVIILIIITNIILYFKQKIDKIHINVNRILFDLTDQKYNLLNRN